MTSMAAIHFESVSDWLEAFRSDPTLAFVPLQHVADLRGVSRAAIDAMLTDGRLKAVVVGGTRYVRVSSIVEWLEARQKEQHDLRKYLAKLAMRGEVTNYAEPMAAAGLNVGWNSDRSKFGAILDRVSRTTYQENRVLLSVIVQDKAKGKPGTGFFNLARELGLTWTDEDELVSRETKKVFKVYRGK